jgi:alpha-glucosidase
MLGYLGSTMSYTESPNAQEQLAQFVQLCKQHKMPCDLFHLSSGYSTGSDGKRYVFTWNKSKVPNPKEMTKTFHDAGIKIAANVKPWLLTTHPDYEIVLQQKAFIRTCDTEYKPELSTLWSGGAFQSSDGAYFDFTNQQAYNWWKSKAKEQLLEYGIDMLWNDNNEFEIWDDDAQCNGFSSTIPIGLIRPIQTLLMNRASFEAQLEHAPTKRPFVLTRSGSPGLQRYAQTWSGDNFSDWNALQYNIPMGLSLSISGFFNTGHDTGGFAGPKPDQELFIRWIQSTIFNPRFCVHSWNTDNTVNELWMYPECIDHVRGLIQFRYKLIPYLYTSLYKSVKDAVPVIRPLVYEFPDDEKVHESSFEFMCGDSLLVACVTEHNATTKKIYLPKGAQWYRYGSTNETIPGGSTIQVDVSDIRTIPLFVRAGSIIPLEEEAGVLKLGVYLDGSNDCTYELFDDDGETNVTHEQYGYAMTTCRVQVENDIVCTASTKCFGGYQSRWKKIEFELYTLEKNVKVNIL